MWEYADQRRLDIIKNRFTTADQFALWVKKEHQKTQVNLSEIAANGVLTLLAIAGSLLDKQLVSQAKAFQEDGGFTERLYRTRIASR